MTISRERDNRGIEPAWNEQEAYALLQPLLRQYATLLAQGQSEPSGIAVWPSEAQHLLEEVEAFLRQQRARTVVQDFVGDPQDGFYLDTTKRVWVRYKDLIGEITTIFGMRGGGKSNSVARITEKLLQRGVPLTVIDPHGEYYSLRALACPLLVVGITGGAASHPDLVVEPAYVAAVADYSVQQGVSIILDLSGLKEAVRYEVLSYYFESLWVACAREKRIYHIVLEEAHAYIPQVGSSPVEKIVSDLSTEYRKFGVGMLIIDQRPANVKKTPITQARVRILHEVDHPLDVERYQELVPKRYSKRMEDILGSFVPGMALVKIHKQIDVIQVETRETVHIGVTPSLDGNAATVDIVRDEHLAQQLAALLATVTPPERPVATGDGRKLQELQLLLAELEAQKETLVHENQVLREQIQLLSNLRITAGSEPTPLFVTLPTTLPIAEAIIEHVHLGEYQEQSIVLSPHASADLAEQLRVVQGRLATHEQELAQKEELISQLRTQVNTLEGGKNKEKTRLRTETPPQTKETPSARPASKLTDSQEILVIDLIEQVNALGSFQRNLLRLLLSHNQEMTMPEIATRMHKTMASVTNFRATQLRALGLVERTPNGYQSLLTSYCHNRLLDAPLSLVRERLLREVVR